MAKNTYKTQPPPKPIRRRRRRSNRLAAWLGEITWLRQMLGSDNAWPIRNIYPIMWVTLLLVLHIAFNHSAERLVRNIHSTRIAVDELRAQATTLEAELARSSKQSELSKRVLADSLVYSQTAPIKLIVNE
jgi:hypothetical protein